jgi:hypothetical protein
MKTRPEKLTGLLATVLLIAGLLELGILPACAQPPEQPTPPRGVLAADEEEAEGGVRAARTELIYLRDAEGNLVPVANLSLEEWDQIYKAQKNLLGRKVPPPVAIEQVVYDGVAMPGHVQMEVQLQLRVVQQPLQRDWISLPLGFHQAVLQKAPQHTGSGDFFVTLNKEKDGHVCWLKADPDTRHTLILNLIVPTQQAGSQSIITLNCPQARSQVKRLAVPLADAVPFSDQLRVTAQADGSMGTIFSFDFAGGQLELAWGKTDMAARKPVTRLQASSTTRFTIKGPEQISMQSEITVKSAVGDVSSFVISLPPGMQVLDLPQGDIRLNVLPPPEGADADSQRVQITSSQPASQLQLTIEAVYRPTVTDTAESEDPEPLDDLPKATLLRGVEIVDAVRQSGFIDFIVDGNWSLSWLQDGDLRRIDEIPDSLLQQQGVARFEFFSPAYLLETGIQPEKTRLRIEPLYLLQVQKDELQLDATLVCQVRGKRGFVLQANLAGWTIDQIISRPAELVDQEKIRLSPDGLLQVPVAASGSGDSQNLEIEISAFRSLAAAQADDSRQLSVLLPRPTTDPLATATVVSRAPGLLIVSPADNIELVPQIDDIQGLVAGATLTDDQQRLLPRRQQVPLVYRDRGDVSSPLFVGLTRIRERAATIDSLARITIDEQQYQVQQELHYSVAYEPVQQVWLDIPATLLLRRSLQVLLVPELEDGLAAESDAAEPQVLPWTEEGDRVSRDPDVRRIVRVDLLQDRIGRFQLLLRYGGQQPTLQADQTVTVPIGLVVPEPDATSVFQQNRVELIVDGVVQAVPREEKWQRAEAALANLPESSNPVFRASEFTDSMPLVVTLGQPGGTVSTQLHQLWLQTYLTSSVRYERAVMRLTTGDRRVRIELPQLARDFPANLRAAINQQPLNVKTLIVNDQGVLEIFLPAGEQKSQVVELWYWSDPASVMPALEIEPPGVVGASSVDRMFWQLITPASEHLLSGPANMTSEQRWTWSRWYWQRQSHMQQSDLEQWIGATVQEGMPSGTNQYLFTSIGPVGSFTVNTVRRSLLVLVVSGVTLLVGVLLIYLPIVRHPLTLLTVTIALAAASVNWPQVVLLIAQAALLGGSLVLLARLLQRGVFWRAGNSPRLLGRATARAENAVDAVDVQLEIGGHGSTASVVMPVDAPATERPA